MTGRVAHGLELVAMLAEADLEGNDFDEDAFLALQYIDELLIWYSARTNGAQR